MKPLITMERKRVVELVSNQILNPVDRHGRDGVKQSNNQIALKGRAVAFGAADVDVEGRPARDHGHRDRGIAADGGVVDGLPK